MVVGREEIEHRLVLERGRVRYVDDDLRAGQYLGEPLAGKGDDARAPRRGGRLVAVLGQPRDKLGADEPGAAVRPSRSIASWYRVSAACPWLTSARESASMPSPKSVPLARVVFASSDRASPAIWVFPLREAASISSGNAHIET
jgi:hypothetical protein